MVLLDYTKDKAVIALGNSSNTRIPRSARVNTKKSISSGNAGNTRVSRSMRKTANTIVSTPITALKRCDESSLRIKEYQQLKRCDGAAYERVPLLSGNTESSTRFARLAETSMKKKATAAPSALKRISRSDRNKMKKHESKVADPAVLKRCEESSVGIKEYQLARRGRSPTRAPSPSRGHPPARKFKLTGRSGTESTKARKIVLKPYDETTMLVSESQAKGSGAKMEGRGAQKVEARSRAKSRRSRHSRRHRSLSPCVLKASVCRPSDFLRGDLPPSSSSLRNLLDEQPQGKEEVQVAFTMRAAMNKADISSTATSLERFETAAETCLFPFFTSGEPRGSLTGAYCPGCSRRHLSLSPGASQRELLPSSKECAHPGKSVEATSSSAAPVDSHDASVSSDTKLPAKALDDWLSGGDGHSRQRSHSSNALHAKRSQTVSPGSDHSGDRKSRRRRGGVKRSSSTPSLLMMAAGELEQGTRVASNNKSEDAANQSAASLTLSDKDCKTAPCARSFVGTRIRRLSRSQLVGGNNPAA